MLPLVLAACITTPNPPRVVYVDDMQFTAMRAISKEDTKPGVLMTLFDVFSGSTAEEREKARAASDAAHLKRMEGHIKALKEKNDPANKDTISALEKLVEEMKSYRR